MNKRIGGTLRAGFTLADLLAVLVIIVLLPAILIPAIQQNSAQHKNVICRANVKQWGMMLAMYANDNDGHLVPGFNMRKGMWMIKLRPYGPDANNIRLCPEATTFLSTVHNMQTSPFTAWGIYGDPGYVNGWCGFCSDLGLKGLYGSYGINGWIHDPPDVGDLYTIAAGDRPNFWRTINVENPSTIPAFGDSVWEGTIVRPTDDVPYVPGVSNSPYNLDGMWNFCLPRHQSGNQYTVNWVFLDNSARKVPIKQLWYQKWSRNFTSREKDWSQCPWATPP